MHRSVTRSSVTHCSMAERTYNGTKESKGNTLFWAKGMTYLLLISAPCSSRNKALALSPLLTALCSSVRPLVVCTSILAPASSSLLATDICPVHRASSKGVWSSLSDKLKSGTMGRRPPLPRLPMKWICNVSNDRSDEKLKRIFHHMQSSLPPFHP